MSDLIAVDLFAEDRAHEELLKPLLERLAREQEREVDIRVRSARGGHGRALAELGLYQQTVLLGVGDLKLPDLLVVAIDANCSTFQEARTRIVENLDAPFEGRAICACPDPHIERWYLDDAKAFHDVVGITPPLGKQKCKRDVYKSILAQAVTDAGQPTTLRGIEFARELVDAMDYYRAGKADNSLKHFLVEAVARL